MENNIKQKTTLREIAKGTYILKRNGSDLVCPIIPPIMIKQQGNPNALFGEQKPQTFASRSGCSSMCPLFKFGEDEEELTAELYCGGEVTSHKIDSIEEITDGMNPTKLDNAN